jgi:molybdopterin-guanine dinucleotide biosynthesis protein A
LFPLDLVARLFKAMADDNADMAMAAAPEADGSVRPQPVFCLLRVDLLDSLVKFTKGGGRKIDAWTGLNRCALVPFDLPEDNALAFSNANTLAELQQLETL